MADLPPWAPPSSRRRWLAAGLAVSVALNLFLIGEIGGHLSARRWLARHDGGRLTMLTRFETLPRAERTRFRATMLRHQAEIGAADQALARSAGQTRAALAANPYDQARMLAAFAAQRQTMLARQTVVQTALADALATLPPEARASLAAVPLTQP